MINSGGCGRRDFGTCAESDAKASGGDHPEIVGPVADGERLLWRKPALCANFFKRSALGLGSMHGLHEATRQRVIDKFKIVGAFLVEAETCSDRARKGRKTARNKRGIGAMRAHGCDERLRAGRRGKTIAEGENVRPIKPFEQRDAFAQRRGKIEFTLHGALGYRGNMRSQALAGGEFVDAFFANDR